MLEYDCDPLLDEPPGCRTKGLDLAHYGTVRYGTVLYGTVRYGTVRISSCLTTNIRFILSLSMYIYIIARAHAKKFEKICTPYNQVCAP